MKLTSKAGFVLLIIMALFGAPSLYPFAGGIPSGILLKQADLNFRQRDFKTAYDKYLEVYKHKQVSPENRERAHFRMGESLERSGETRLAIREFESLLKEGATTYSNITRSKLISLYRQMERWDKAIPMLKEEISSKPGFRSNYEQLAEIYVDREEYQQALDVYSQIISRFPTIRKTIELKLIPVYEQMGLLDQKIDELKIRLIKAANKDELHRLIAMYYHYQNKYGEAIEHYLKIKRHDVGYYRTLGRYYFENQEHEAAKQAWRTILLKNPGNLYYYKEVISLMQKAGFYDEVVKIYLQARQELHRPNDFKMELAHVYEVMGDLDKAMQEYFGLIKVQLSARRKVVEAIDTAISEGEPLDRIVGAIERSIKADPGNPEPHIVLGDLYLKLDKPDLAQKQYLLVISKSKNKEVSIYVQARKLINKKKYQQAAVLYDELFPIKRTRILSPELVEVANVYLRLGKYEQAKKVLNKITKRGIWDLMNALALLKRGEVYFAQAEYQRALEDFQLVTEKYQTPDEYEKATIFISRCLYRLGKPEQAEQNIDELLVKTKQGDNYFEALLLSAKLKLFQDKKEEARKTLQELAEKHPQAYTSNDALALIRYLEKTSNKHLDVVIEALNHKERGEYADSIRILKDLLEKKLPKNADRIWLEVGILQRLDKKPLEAIRAFQIVTARFPDSLYLAKAQFLVASTYLEDLRDNEQALSAYKDLLVKHPDSILVNEARMQLGLLEEHVAP